MASRLPLIVSQPARRDAVLVDLIESIVAGALMIPKLDANLVGDIAELEPGGTDHLCLQGHTRDLILVSCLGMEQAESAWKSLGQDGYFVDCSLPAVAIRESVSRNGHHRRVFFFRLLPQTRPAQLLQKCQELVDSQATPLVSLGLGSLVSKEAGASSMATPVSMQPGANNVHSTAPPNGKSIHSSRSAAYDSEDLDDQQWSALDKLVDDLDAADL